MNIKPPGFHPFYDPYRDGNALGYGHKIGLSLGFGAFYLMLQIYSLPDKMVFFEQYCWILGIIISTSVLALYIVTDVFRRSLATFDELQGTSQASSSVIAAWLSDKYYLYAGFGFATINTSIAHLLGVPIEFHASVFSLTVVYVGFFLAGFVAGIGLLAIFSVILIYLKLAPNLQHSLDPNNADGNGGIKKLGDTLWFFAFLIGALAVLISIYLFGVQWVFLYKPYVRTIFVFWVAFPYIVAISIVLIPGLAVNRQVRYFKIDKAKQLQQEKSKLYSSFKQFESKEDKTIIEEKRELSEKLDSVQDELIKLKKMRTSHIDRVE